MNNALNLEGIVVLRDGRIVIVNDSQRDFTMNGLSVDADGVVHDYVGGIADVAARRAQSAMVLTRSMTALGAA